MHGFQERPGNASRSALTEHAGVLLTCQGLHGAGACLGALIGAAAALEGHARLHAAITHGLCGALAAGDGRPAEALHWQVQLLACTAMVHCMHVHGLVLVAAVMGVCSIPVWHTHCSCGSG